MAQSDSNSEDALDDLVNRVKNRRAEGKRPPVFVTQTGGLRPSEMLLMPAGQKKLIYYLSHHRYASIEDIKQALEFEQGQTLNILSILKDAGYIHETLVNGEIFYRVKFIDTTVRSNSLPKELWNMLSLEGSAFLHQLPLFKKLSQIELDSISRQFKQEHYARNDIIMRQGDLAKSFFIIKSGVVAVTNLCKEGGYNLIRYLEQGDFFGESGLLTGQSVSATIIASTPADILVISKDDFYKMLAGHHEITIELARMLAYLLSDMNTQLANKLVDSNLFLVISTGKQIGATTIANAMTLMSAASKVSTALLEFPGNQLPSIYGFPPMDETFNHPGNFHILNPKNGADISEQERAMLAMDRASTQFKNIIINISWELVEHLDILIRSASQIVVVTSARQEDWTHTQKVIDSIQPYIRTNKTRLFTLVNHRQIPAPSEIIEATPDFMVPYLGDLPPIAERRLENLPKPLTAVIIEIFKRLRYTNQIGIYIPTTIDAKQQPHISACVEKTFSFMKKVFGSATQEQVQDVWNSQDAGLVENDIYLIRSFCSQPVLDFSRKQWH
jgi:CRP-like cAMP-binding protein